MRVRIHLPGRPAPEAGARESLQGPITLSMILHGIIFGLVMFGGVLVSPTRGVQWGEAGARGGAVPVSLIPSVPLLSTMGPENPLASPTKEMNPAEPKPPARQQPKQPSAKEFQQAEREANRKLADLERRQLERELAAVRSREVAGNAIPGTTASGRAASPIYGMSTGQGAGGIGFAGEFGTVYGWYVRQVRECISRHWDQSRVDAVVRSAPRVYLEFDIERDGTIRGERIATSSSIPSIDREALRSVQACSGRRDVGADAHLPALPGDYRGSSVHVEVWFEFQK